MIIMFSNGFEETLKVSLANDNHVGQGIFAGKGAN